MAKKVLLKSVSILLVLLMLFNVFSPLVSYGAYTIDSAYLQDAGTWYSSSAGVLYQSGRILSVSVVGYYFNDGQNWNPAYCIDPDLGGAGDTEYGSYTVNNSGIYSNDAIWRILKNGYGFNSAADMGLSSDWDAYAVTKYAIWCVLGAMDVGSFYGTTTYGQTWVNVLNNLVNIGLYGTETYSTDQLWLTANGSIEQKTINGVEYYVQNYSVTSGYSLGTYQMQLSGFTSGTKIFNEAMTEEQYIYTGNSVFNVAIPVSEVTGYVYGEVYSSNFDIETMPIWYGATTVGGSQNYVLVADPYEYASRTAILTLSVPSVSIFKSDRDTGESLAGACYNIYKDVNSNGVYDEGVDEFVIEVGATDSNGETAFSGLTPGDYVAVESVAPEGYNLDSEDLPFTIELNGDTVKLYSTDTVITSTINVTKESLDDSELTGWTAGTLLANATFEIYYINSDGTEELVETITTDESGTASIELPYGNYRIVEVQAPEYYLLDEETNVAYFTVDTEGEEIELTFQNEAVKLGLEITKSGIVQTQANDEIRYDFTITNNSNVDVDNFTWRDELPYEYVTLTQLFTGTYNYDHDYTVWYKTTDSDEWIQYVNEDTEDGTYNTLVDNYIDFSVVDGEITEFKLEFGTVEPDFASTEESAPFIFCKVKSTVGADDEWTNYTYLTGDYTSDYGTIVELEDQDEWTTISYAYSLSISKLPKTGF